MAIAFRLNNDRTVSILNKPSSTNISRIEFETKSKRIEFDKFLSCFKNQKTIDTLTDEMELLIKFAKVSMLGPVVKKDELTNIRDLSNPLDKSQSFIKKNNSR